MKKTAIYIWFILAGLLGSCQEGEEFKKPTDVGFQMDIKREASTNGKLQFTSGYIILTSFSFDGRREEGGDVFFSKSYERGLRIEFDPNQTVDALNFQIPQGNYSRIEIELETYDATDIPGLVVSGFYHHSNGTRIPLRLELESSFEFEIQAKEDSGSAQIVLIHSKPTSPVIRLNPIEWFEVVPPSFLENAEQTSSVAENEETEGIPVVGSPFILINEAVNENIYEIIVSRIAHSAEVVFK